MRKINLLLSLLLIIGIAGHDLLAQEKQLAGFNYISPRPDAQYTNPESAIAFRLGDEINLYSVNSNTIKVVGSLSGELSGTIQLSKDNQTLIFKSTLPFQYNETVTVEVKQGIKTLSGIEIAPFSYSFNSMKEDNSYLNENFINWLNEGYKKSFDQNYIPTEKNIQGVKNTIELPEDFPPYYVSLHNNPSPGYIFANPQNLFHPLVEPSYSVIMDHYGTPVYYLRSESHTFDFKMQETGHFSQFIIESSGGIGIGYGTYYTYDSYMNVVDSFQMGNGYTAEMHDFQLFNDGSSLLLTYDAQIVDMSEIVEGGDPAATVMGAVVQELDADKNVVFQWSSWDHMEITDATPDIDLTGVFIDYCHINAIERDDDGNILLSFRNTDEIIKVNRETGDMTWRLNAYNNILNDFTFVNDTIKFSHQHDIRRQENGNITIFDNGNLHYGPYSRICEYTLDEVNMTASLAWVYPPEPGVGNHFAFATGNAQRQSDGNTFIGWGLSFGTVLMLGEVTPDHQKTFEIYGMDTITTYRAHKYQWETDMFSLSKDTIDWGEFTGYTPEPYILQVTNNYTETITISGTHNRTQEYYVASSFPITIDPGTTENITINFFPANSGYFEDALTVMCEKGEFEMIGKQVILKGHTIDEDAPEASFDPENESTDINRMPTLKLSFNEKLFTENGEIITNDVLQYLVFLHQDGGEEVPFKAWISWYDNNKTEITIQPFDFLEATTIYNWGSHNDVVKDWAGNMVIMQSATFTTGEEMGVDDILVNDFARIFPNPTQGYLTLEFINNDDKSVVIYNVSGEEIIRAENLNGLTYSFNISDQPDGVYIVRVFNQLTNSSVELKVIKK